MVVLVWEMKIQNTKISDNLDDYSSYHNDLMFSTYESTNCIKSSECLNDCPKRFIGGWWMWACYKFCLTCESSTGNYLTALNGGILTYYHFDRIKMSIQN